MIEFNTDSVLAFAGGRGEAAAAGFAVIWAGEARMVEEWCRPIVFERNGAIFPAYLAGGAAVVFDRFPQPDVARAAVMAQSAAEECCGW